MVEKFITRKTVRLRHRLARLLAPKLFSALEPVSVSYVPRPMTLFLKTYFHNESLFGVEIGVAEAKNAVNMLETLNIQTLWLVDPYTPYVSYDQKLMTHHTNSFQVAEKQLSKFKDKICFIKKTSTDALPYIPDGLDFVYIDGDHTFDAVKKDIQNYYIKIKQGGVLGGHDFRNIPDVCKAVTLFVVENKLEINVEGADWWIIK